MLIFGTTDAKLIVVIIQAVDDKKTYVSITKTHHLSKHFIKKIYKHFKVFKTEENIQAELKSIDITNTTRSLYKYDRTGYYKLRAEYYRTYMNKRRLRIRIEKAKKLILDNAAIIEN